MSFAKKLLFILTLAALISCPVSMRAHAAAKPAASRTAGSAKAAFRAIDLDRFIVQEKKAVGKDKKRIIRMAAPVSFEARMKRNPEEKKMTYVYEVLELSGVKPLPEVKHRMFVESRGRRIIPVYVERRVVDRIGKELTAGSMARFVGYHLYSYGKGPAIMVVDFAAAR